MGSRQNTPIDLTFEASSSRAISAVPSESSLPNAFGRMMAGKPKVQEVIRRDRCTRLEPTYNVNYNPFEKPPKDLPRGYSPYVFGEPLWDDRPVVVARLPSGYSIARPSKKKRTTWV
jgi:hypothetical protein